MNICVGASSRLAQLRHGWYICAWLGCGLEMKIIWTSVHVLWGRFQAQSACQRSFYILECFILLRDKKNNLRVDREKMKRQSSSAILHSLQKVGTVTTSFLLWPLPFLLSPCRHCFHCTFTRPLASLTVLQENMLHFSLPRFFWLWLVRDKLGHLLCLYHKVA